MLIYNLIFAFTLLGIILFSFGNRKKFNDFYYWILSSFIILVVALRSENIGYDTSDYMYVSLHPDSFEWKFSEPVLIYLYKFLSHVWYNKYVINFIVATISTIPIFIMIKKYSENRYYTIFFYISFSIAASIFIISLAAVRQTLAIGIFSMAILFYLKNNEKINFKVIIALLLMLFTHNSSILAIILFAMIYIKIPKKIYYVVAIGSSILGLSISKYIELFVIFFGLSEKEFYFSNSMAEVSLKAMIPYLGSFIYVIYSLPKDKIQNIWIKGYFLSVVLSGLLQTLAFNLDRMCSYYYLTACFAIPMLISNFYFKKRNTFEKFTFYSFNILMLYYFSYKYFLVWDILSEGESSPVPYESFLNTF